MNLAKPGKKGGGVGGLFKDDVNGFPSTRILASYLLRYRAGGWGVGSSFFLQYSFKWQMCLIFLQIADFHMWSYFGIRTVCYVLMRLVQYLSLPTLPVYLSPR
jgi:hypothetical protein